MQETWKDIAGYEGLYQVSDLGRVRSFYSGETKILKPQKNNYGYLQVGLYKNGKSKLFLVHRLVCLHFNPCKMPWENCINHINEDKSDNRLGNLEWCTHEYNNQFNGGYIRRGKTQSISIVQLTLEGKFIKEWQGAREVERETGINKGNIIKCCKHNPKRNSAGGYRWFYLSEYEQLCYRWYSLQQPFRLALPYRA